MGRVFMFVGKVRDLYASRHDQYMSSVWMKANTRRSRQRPETVMGKVLRLVRRQGAASDGRNKGAA